MDLAIRSAERSDVPRILSLIVELAEYERAPDQVKGNAELLTAALFGSHPSAEAVIAELDGQPVGFALFHSSFSTWECRPGIWLEDLYVPPEHRRAGVGQALLRHLAEIAVGRGCTRLEWAALHWNTPALDFYDKLGATRLDEWRMHRLDGEALALLAGPAAADR
ncbi:MAG: GNAT family N-acetyltransferase [Solirubrobacteraceae bacterium]